VAIVADRLTPTWQCTSSLPSTREAKSKTEGKLAAIRGFGVTRLSLGIEGFDDRLLELNGRAHRSPEIFRAYQEARALAFPQINVDLIAGMLGETDAGWRASVDGDPAPVLQANALFRAVPVPAGRPRVELRYRPPEAALGAALSALAAVLGLVAWSRRRAADATLSPERGH